MADTIAHSRPIEVVATASVDAVVPDAAVSGEDIAGVVSVVAPGGFDTVPGFLPVVAPGGLDIPVVAVTIEHTWLPEVEIVKGASGWDDAQWNAAVAASLEQVADAAARAEASTEIATEVTRMQGWLDGRPQDAPAEVSLQLQVGDVSKATTIRIRMERP